uniref:Uncharacterized protein n=1 Tax=Fagus sylvatica TaxID=28930 RepID=A0A2N9IPW0_FAGSY
MDVFQSYSHWPLIILVALNGSRGGCFLMVYVFGCFLAAVFHYGGCGFGLFYGSVLVLLGGLFLLSSLIINGTASARVIVVALL